MRIILEPKFKKNFKNIVDFIAKDKKVASINFKNELKGKFEILKQNPKMCRKSFYFENEAYRDLIFKGYTIIYKIESKEIRVLDIFKWESK